ncbi:MAG: hypothetical protein CMF31_05360 [Kordiimonas sp.]|nr:hypothetical protein [Kordiimonas sp.]
MKKLAHAVILAGRRPEGDPVADAYRVPFKALVTSGSRLLIEHVCDSLKRSGHVQAMTVMLQNPSALTSRPELADYNLKGIKSGASISKNIALAMDTLHDQFPLLITTGDHPLLLPEHISTFITAAEESDADIVIGFATRDTVMTAYPETQRTWLQFSDVTVTGCNLFYIRNAKTRKVFEVWQEMEKDRKQAMKIAWKFGPLFFILMLMKWISLPKALARLARPFDIKIEPVLLPFADTAIDADKISDMELIAAILTKREVLAMLAEDDDD